MKYYFGIDIGGTTVKLGLFTEDGTLQTKWEIKTNTEAAGRYILPDVADAVSGCMASRSLSREDVVAIGVGVPAAVIEAGVSGNAVNLGWDRKDVARELGVLTGLPVFVQNDANLAALGEMWKGSGAGYQSLIMVTLGTGVGGGIIVDGQLVTGIKGGAGEIGELIAEIEIQRDGTALKRNLEYYASATGIVRLAKKRLQQSCTTLLDPNTVTAKAVFDAVKAGDTVATEIVDTFAAYLGKALTDLAVVLDPEAFIIGGGVSRAGDILLEYLSKHSYIPNSRLVLATLGNDAGIYGAARLAMLHSADC